MPNWKKLITSGSNATLSSLNVTGDISVAGSIARYDQAISGNSSYTITHNLNEDYPIVQIYDTDKHQVLPASITASNANTVDLEFDSNFTGRVVVKK